MLYLFRSFTRTKTLLKVGYAIDLENRLQQHKNSNPGLEVISTRGGSREDEMLLHIYLHFLGYGAIKDEWYIDSPKVISEFHKDIESIKRVIWRCRDKIFPANWISTALEKKWKLVYDITRENRKTSQRNPIDIMYGKKYLKTASKKMFVIETDDLSLINLSTEFNLHTRFTDKMRTLCEFIKKNEDRLGFILSHIPEDYKKYIMTLGPDQILSLSCIKVRCEQKFSDLTNTEVENKITSSFGIGDKISLSDIKTRLQEIYTECGINKKASAVDLQNFFNVKECRITNKTTGKRSRGFKIVRRRS